MFPHKIKLFQISGSKGAPTIPWGEHITAIKAADPHGLNSSGSPFMLGSPFCQIVCQLLWLPKCVQGLVHSPFLKTSVFQYMFHFGGALGGGSHWASEIRFVRIWRRFLWRIIQRSVFCLLIFSQIRKQSPERVILPNPHRQVEMQPDYEHKSSISWPSSFLKVVHHCPQQWWVYLGKAK